ncbi:MAG: amino acid adenylation domain-containing protein, partial [Acidobacteria bacterium]|nr:amino acid adenylation domain-containing protein [Acidobacteriota bacterium]
SGYAAPRTPTEEMLAGIFAAVLGAERVGVHDNFFELGGHSLLATQAVARARKAFGVELALNALFESPTAAGLAAEVEEALREGAGLEGAPIIRVERGSGLPLSFAQQRLWFLDQLEPGTSAYNIPAAVRLRGELDIPVLERTLSEVVRRHEVLRTTFETVGEEPRQVIHPAEPIRLGVRDLSPMAEEEREAEAVRLAAEESRRPFDLSRDLMLRASLLRLGEQDHVVLFTLHHIASDGWSMGVLVREVAALYQSYLKGEESPLEELPIQYADYAAWQRARLQGEALEGQLSYWKRQLSGLPVLELPTDRPRPAVQSFKGAYESLELGSELSAGLKELSRREGATLFMTLLAGWQALLSRYSGQEDISVGSFIANRNRAETEGLIGFFLNNLALRTDLSGNPTFRELLARVREVALGAYLHQDLPFELVLEAIQPERDASRTRLFQVMFVLQNTPKQSLELPALKLSGIEAKNPRANFDLTLWMWETPTGLGGAIEYNTDLFDQTTVARMVEHFQTLLEGAVANPEERVGRLPLLREWERRRLLVEWNDTAAPYERDRCIHELIEEQAARAPEATAVVFEDRRMTYGELNARANRIARRLRALGVGPEVRVGVCVERSMEMVVGVLAVLKAGGAYVPLDPAYPTERLVHMMEDSRAPVLLTQQRLLKSLPEHDMPTLALDGESEPPAPEDAENLARTAAADNLAYVIYTSGSTRKPRGAMISHRSLVNAYRAWESSYELGTEVRCSLQTASFAFDVFSGDLVRALCSGGKLIICPGELLLSAPDFYELLRRERVDGFEVVPAILRNLIQHLEETNQSLDFMRLIVAGADVWYYREFEQTKPFCGPRTRLINSYGLTEATIDSTFFERTELELPPGKVAPIGRPFANTTVYLLDRNLEPVPIGVVGELHVGGPGLARGYLNHPDLTAAKFIPDPFSTEPGARLYKTGDLARYLVDGNVEFLGRGDFQVKVRGFRVELEEIETVLASHPNVRHAVVLAREEAPGDKRLVAYVVPREEPAPTAGELHRAVKERLPAYMVPSAFVTLEALPLTPNGKIDRKALPAPDFGRAEEQDTYVEPSTDVEALLAGIWSEVLGVEKVGVHDNFFESGGHSLLATQVIARVRKTFQVEVPLRSLFESPTIAELAVTVEEILLDEIEDELEDEPEDESAEAPAS